MGWYERVVFNRIMEFVLDAPHVHRLRRAALAPVRGEILDVGTGTGLNLPHYPSGVERITAVTLDDALDRRAVRRAQAARVRVDHLKGDGRRLPFDAGRFDTVVVTFVLCSVGDPEGTVRELRRVLKADGRLLFLEHVIAPPGTRRTLQRLVAPPMQLINCGCSPVRDTARTIARGGFDTSGMEEFDVPEMPWPVRRLIRGAAAPKG